MFECKCSKKLRADAGWEGGKEKVLLDGACATRVGDDQVSSSERKRQRVTKGLALIGLPLLALASQSFWIQRYDDRSLESTKIQVAYKIRAETWQLPAAGLCRHALACAIRVAVPTSEWDPDLTSGEYEEGSKHRLIPRLLSCKS